MAKRELTKAQRDCVSRYVKGHYNQIMVRVPIGDGDTIKARAKAAGQSVNGYIVQAIRERMERDGIQPAPDNGPPAE